MFAAALLESKSSKDPEEGETERDEKGGDGGGDTVRGEGVRRGDEPAPGGLGLAFLLLLATSAHSSAADGALAAVLWSCAPDGIERDIEESQTRSLKYSHTYVESLLSSPPLSSPLTTWLYVPMPLRPPFAVELREVESQRMCSDKVASENADIAHAWKERCESYETAYKGAQTQLAVAHTRAEEAEREVARMHEVSRRGSVNNNTVSEVQGRLDTLKEELDSSEKAREAAAKEIQGLKDQLAASQHHTRHIEREHNESRRLLGVSTSVISTYMHTCEAVEMQLATTQVIPARSSTPHAALFELLAAINRESAASGMSAVPTAPLFEFLTAAHSGVTSHTMECVSEACERYRQACNARDTEHRRAEETAVELNKRQNQQHDNVQATMKAVADDYEKKLDDLLTRATTERERALAGMQSQQSAVILKLQQEHEAAIARLQSEHRDAFTKFEQKWQSEKASLEAHMEEEMKKVRTSTLAENDVAIGDLRRAYETNLESRSKLVKEWEEYANHWESRGREAERMNGEWEAAFDKLQAEYTKLLTKHTETVARLESFASPGSVEPFRPRASVYDSPARKEERPADMSDKSALRRVLSDLGADVPHRNRSAGGFTSSGAGAHPVEAIESPLRPSSLSSSPRGSITTPKPGPRTSYANNANKR